MDFVAIDVETANADYASICQIGLARYSNGKLAQTWKSYIDPQTAFDPANVAVHGIDTRTVRGAPTFPEISSLLRKWLRHAVVVSHTPFDRVALRRAFARYGLPDMDLTWLDTSRVARHAWEQCAERGYGLRDVCQMLGYRFRHHDALEDAKAAAYILLRASAETGLDTAGWLRRVEDPIRKEAMMERRYYYEVKHDGLGKHRIISGMDEQLVKAKALAQHAEWERSWQDRERKRKAAEKKRLTLEQGHQAAEERTREAQQALDELGSLLAHTLRVDDAIDWESLKDTSLYPTPAPAEPAAPPEPNPNAERYQPKLGCLGQIVPSKRRAAVAEAKALLEQERHGWGRQVEELAEQHQAAVVRWEADRDAFLEEQRQRNEHVDQRRQEYLSRTPEAVVDYCDMVLAKSQYPDCLPATFELDFVADTMTLVVDYQLPCLEDVPRLKEVKYVVSRKEFRETVLSQAQLNSLYDIVIYQIALRTVHELFEADRAAALAAVVFNGWVTAVDPGTGQEKTVCILSLHTTKEQFMAINLARVEPKQCFRSLKGVGSSKLHSLTPIAPILQIDREDRRFIQSYAVADTLDEGYNLATMPWEDFEHLVRELFEKEFTQSGGEVKVTQASRDGGVDAVAFDPDPIRGGRIVIQAKRYTRTVGVAAVRDLYGTVVNEGATKGILVTTSDYGPDAYEFAQGKPITLLTGAHLLHLLERHGYRARIDLQEARQIPEG